MPYIAKEVSPQAPDYPYFGVHTNGQVVESNLRGLNEDVIASTNEPIFSKRDLSSWG